MIVDTAKTVKIEAVKNTLPYPRITLLIPAKNEEKNLPHVLPKIPPIIDEVILVDGLSSDRTNELARELRPDIKVIKQEGRGKGNAIQAGIQEATGEFIVMIDADGSMNPEEIPSMVSALANGYDFVKGSRFLRGGGTTDMENHRRAGNRLFVFLVNLLFHGKYTDMCYGYCAFKREAVDKLDIKSEGFEIETELNCKALKAGLSVTELPSFEEKRLSGAGNLHSFRDGWRIMKIIFKLRFGR